MPRDEAEAGTYKGRQKPLDATGKKNGRGAYVCKNIDCIKKIAKQKALSRAFGIPVEQEIYDTLQKEFAEIE